MEAIRRGQMKTKSVAKNVLESVNLLDEAQRIRVRVHSGREDLYLRRLLPLYRHPLSQPLWDFEPWLNRQAELRRGRVEARFRAGQKAILARLFWPWVAPPPTPPDPPP